MNEINKQVKDGKTAGIAIGSLDDSVQIGFIMKSDVSTIQINEGSESFEIQVKSTALLAVSKIITETLK